MSLDILAMMIRNFVLCDGNFCDSGHEYVDSSDDEAYNIEIVNKRRIIDDENKSYSNTTGRRTLLVGRKYDI